MKIFKKIIYIGEVEGNAIYFDTEKQLPLKAPKSKLLDTDKSKNNYKYITTFVVIILVAKGGSYKVPVLNPFSGNYNFGTLFLLAMLWLFEFIGFTSLVYRALYKNVNQSVFADNKEFGKAIKSNNIWNVFGDKKATRGKKIYMVAIILIIIILTLSIAPMLYMANKQEPLIGHRIGPEIIGLSLLGIMPFVTVLLIWLNNPLRWLNVVEQYQKGK